MAAKYQKAGDSERDKIKSELQRNLNELFDRREIERKKEVEKLAELKKALGVRSNNKEEIIKRRMQELLGETKYLRWD